MERTFRRCEMQHVSIFPEHVDLLNTRDGLNIEFLQRALQLLVILGSGWLAFSYNLSPDCPLSACDESIGTSNPHQ